MALSSWLRTKNTRNMLVKIVYPGGRVELHDRPILAAEILVKNPRCFVTHPDVFRQPWAVVSPDTVLMLGQKFYVVPVSTLRKLRWRSCRNPNSPHHDIPSPSPTISVGNDRTSSMDASRLLPANSNTPKRSFGCLRCCFKSLLTGAKPKPARATTDGMTGSMGESLESREINRKRAKKNSTREISSPERRMKNLSPGTPGHHWQPNLQSITEE